MPSNRALGVVRISVGSLHSTGKETQLQRLRKRIEADERTLVDFAVDIDVSAEKSPWEREGLGPWLNERRDEFDVLYVLKLDRIIRSAFDLLSLLKWCKEHDKSLVSVEENIDFSTPTGKIFATILAAIAEAELDAIKFRIRASRESLRAVGRWPGGVVPFGRRAVPVTDGDGYTLGIDPEYGPVLEEMIEKFLEWRSFAAVAD